MSTTSTRTESAHQARTLRVERPVLDQVLHPGGIVTARRGHLLVQFLCGPEPVAVQADPEAGRVRDGDLAAADPRRFDGEPFQAFLPDPVGVEGVVVARRGGTAVR